MKNFKYVAFIVLLIYMGCSGTTAVRIQNDADDRLANGFRYYESSPYILVYSDGTSLKSNLIYLPDTTRKMSIELTSLLSKNVVTLKFSDGVLTESDIEQDSTTVPKAIVEAAKTAAIAAAGAFNLAVEEEGKKPELFRAPPPYLFKLIVEGVNSRLITGSAVTMTGEPLTIKLNFKEKEKS